MEHRISVKAELTTLCVDDDNVTGPWDGTKEHPYQNITNALENATDGDTIFVHAGIYYENVIVNKSVSLVGEDQDSTIVDGNETGNVIVIKKADNIRVRGFTIKRSGPTYGGIFIELSNGNDISHNTITNNHDGIRLRPSSHNVISGNTIADNYCGISLYSSSHNVISGNTITSNTAYGISVSLESTNNVISGNTITLNYWGMHLAILSSNNIIYLNNFFNNTNQAYSDSENFWDDGDEGNYWRDYKGQDLDGDGIGDTPRILQLGNRDNHPLMGMFSDFTITFEIETCHVITICNSTISEFRFEIGPETGNKIIRFNAKGKNNTVGFCRVTIPTKLMNYPYIVLVGAEEIVPTLLDVSNETHAYIYFTYIHSSHTITIISSKTLHLYNELLEKHIKLQMDLYNLNATYHDLLENYSLLLGDYNRLQKSYRELNNSYYAHLNNYGSLLSNYSRLQESYRELNNSYHEHLSGYFKNVHNIRNLMYIFAATTGIFIITTIYLSNRAHAKPRYPKTNDVHTQEEAI